MSDYASLLRTSAHAILQDVFPLALENRRLSRLFRLVEIVENPEPRYTLSHGVWLDYQRDVGVDTKISIGHEGLRIELRKRGNSPWFTLSYGVSIHGLRKRGYLGQITVFSSRGTANARVCLRYTFQGGFKDVYAKDQVTLTGGKQQDLIFIPVDQKLARDALGAEVLMFFDGRKFDTTLHSVKVLRV